MKNLIALLKIPLGLFSFLCLLTLAAPLAYADGQECWTGQGVTNGELNTIICDEENPPGSLHWIFSLGGTNTVTNASLTINNQSQPDGNQTGNVYHFNTGWFPLDPSQTNACAAYVGELGGGEPGLRISHGCPPEDRFWCSPGFWRNHPKLSPVDLSTPYGDIGGPATSYSTKKTACAKMSATPTLQEVLDNPQCYGGPAFNAVATYLSCAAFTSCGDETTGDNCPLDAHGTLAE